MITRVRNRTGVRAGRAYSLLSQRRKREAESLVTAAKIAALQLIVDLAARSLDFARDDKFFSKNPISNHQSEI